MPLETTVRQIREAGAQGVAIVSRDGSVIGADLPPHVSKETFSIMCATIHGAGMTVSNEARRPPPQRIVLESSEGRIVITEAGRRALVVLVLAPDADLGATLEKMGPLFDEVARDTG